MNTKKIVERRLGAPALRGLLVGVAILVALLLALAAGSVLFLSLDAKTEFASQSKRLAGLRAASPSPSPRLAADLALDDSLPFDRLRLLATHNSYRRGGSTLGLLLIGLIQPGEPAKLAYSHPPLSDQLDEGIRSFELDLRARREDFVVAHVPLVDARTWEPDFSLALEELALWSKRNPRHLPLVLLLELKEDYAFLDPSLRPWSASALDRLDRVLREGLGPRLFTPDDLAATRAAAKGGDRGARVWPRLAELRDRVLVVLHENETYRALYEAGRPGLEGRAMFDCLPGGGAGAFFAVLNDPRVDREAIRAATARGVIVRTRADAELALDPAGLEAALASGAQIVSTDFPRGHPGTGGYVAALPGGRTFDILP